MMAEFHEIWLTNLINGESYVQLSKTNKYDAANSIKVYYTLVI